MLAPLKPTQRAIPLTAIIARATSHNAYLLKGQHYLTERAEITPRGCARNASNAIKKMCADSPGA